MEEKGRSLSEPCDIHGGKLGHVWLEGAEEPDNKSCEKADERGRLYSEENDSASLSELDPWCHDSTTEHLGDRTVLHSGSVSDQQPKEEALIGEGIMGPLMTNEDGSYSTLVIYGYVWVAKQIASSN